MQTKQDISEKQLFNLFELIYQIDNVVVTESHSSYDKPLQVLLNSEDLKMHFNESKKYRSYAVYYPNTKGKVSVKTVKLTPDEWNGHTKRYEQEGWGIIFIQCRTLDEKINCRVSVNSEARARKWEEIYPEFGSVDDWDWVLLKKISSKIIRTLRELSKTN